MGRCCTAQILICLSVTTDIYVLGVKFEFGPSVFYLFGPSVKKFGPSVFYLFGPPDLVYRTSSDLSGD